MIMIVTETTEIVVKRKSESGNETVKRIAGKVSKKRFDKESGKILEEQTIYE